MNKEVVRSVWIAIGCSLLFVILGFLPLWISESSIWSASRTAQAAMPVGESGVSDVTGPLKIAKTPTVLGDPAMHP
ncbi:MAG TPA: hypothetical protein VMU11_02810 [Verrucomicrobiae bacterium]|nr:hypothetical protein [Verrucomicrobiae bacterium]